MTPLETLFRLEIEFHRRLRTQTVNVADVASLHTSYALQSGYERLIPGIGRITVPELKAMRERLGLAGDPRDVLAASDSLILLIGVGPNTL